MSRVIFAVSAYERRVSAIWMNVMIVGMMLERWVEVDVSEERRRV